MSFKSCLQNTRAPYPRARARPWYAEFMRWIGWTGILAGGALALAACNMPNPAFGPQVTGTGSGSDTDQDGSGTTAGTASAGGSSGDNSGGSDSGGATTGTTVSDSSDSGDATTGGVDPSDTNDTEPATTGPMCDTEPCDADQLNLCVSALSFETCVDGCIEPVFCDELEYCHADGGDGGAACMVNEQCESAKGPYLEQFNPPGDGAQACLASEDCVILKLGCNFGAIGCPAVNHDAANFATEIVSDWETAGCFLAECPACDGVQAKCMKENPDPQAPGFCAPF